MPSLLLLLLGGAAVAAGLIARGRSRLDERLSSVLIGLGIALLLVSIVTSGLAIGRS